MSPTTPKPTAALTRFLGEFTRYRPRLLAVAFVLMLGRSLSEGLSFLLLIPLLGLDQVSTSGLPASEMTGGLARIRSLFGGLPLGALLGLFLGAVSLRALLGYASSVATATYLAGLIDHVRCRVYGVLSRASWLHLAASRQAEDTRALTLQTESVGDAAWLMLSLAAAILTLLTGIGVAFMLSPLHTLAVLAAALCLVWPLLRFQRWAYERGQATAKAYQGLYDTIVARMNGLKLAKAFAIEKPLEEDFAASSAALRQAQTAGQETSARATLVQELTAAVLVVALVYIALAVLRIANVELVLLIMIFARLLPLGHAIQSYLRSLAGLLPDYELLRARETAALAAAEPLPDNGHRLALRQTLAVRGLHFGYPGSGEAVVRDVSLAIAAGSAVGILGLSGAGKSTLADIMAGLIVPDAGDVTVDGAALDAATRPRWRASVAYVPQDAPLFHDTLRANLRLAARDASDAELWAALETVHAAELVRRLPDGLETLAGDRGVRLSGGERQRLRLASALLRKPRVLILDESTNALSPRDEDEIITVLQRARGSMTILLIAHRPSSVAWTDRVIVLRDGRVVADGPPEEILRDGKADDAAPANSDDGRA